MPLIKKKKKKIPIFRRVTLPVNSSIENPRQ
jgi:hypothetical protein